MNKKALLIIGLVVAAGAGILFFQNTRQQNQLDQKVNQAQTAQATIESTDVKVDIEGYAFKNQIIKIKKGTKVTWTNRDNAPHSVTSDKDKLLNSAILSQNGSYEKVFDTVGTFRYHCTPHPNMLAAVIVVE